MHTENAQMPSFQTQGRRGKTPNTYRRNGEMESNSTLKIHVIYHFLQGDWEKAMSRRLLAGAGRQQEPVPGASVLVPFVHGGGPRRARAASFHQSLSHRLETRQGGCRGTGGATSASLNPAVPSQTDIPRAEGFGVQAGGWLTVLYFPQEAWHPSGPGHP